MAEDQVLTLTTQFDDQASAAIAGVKQALDQLKSSGFAEAQRRLRSETDEFGKALGGVAREAAGLGRHFTEFSKALGGVSLSAGVMVYEMGRSLRAMKEWSAEVVEMGNAARMAGLGFAEFQSITRQLQSAGINNAGAMLTGFNRAWAEMMTLGSKRQQLLNMAGAANVQGMAQFIRQLSQLTDEVDRLNAVRHAGENVYQNTFNRTHDKILAHYDQFRFLEQFHAEQLINYQRDLTKEDVKRLQIQEQRHAKAQELNEAFAQEKKTRDEIKDVMVDLVAGPETDLIYMLIDIERDILRQMEALSKGKIIPTWEEFTRFGPSENEINTRRFERFPSSGLTPPRSQMTPEQLRLYERLSRPDLATQLGAGSLPAATGPATRATHFMGGDGEDFWANWRRSENVEDERGTSVNENTREIRQLNQNLQELIDRSPGGGALGAVLGSGSIGGGAGYGPSGYGPSGTGPSGTGPSGTGPDGTVPPPPPVTGPAGTPLAALHGGMPFGINVSPQRFSEITGLPPSFMNVTAGQRAYARAISTGAVSPPSSVQTTGLKPQSAWPSLAAPGGATGGGYGATGPTSASGPQIRGITSIDALEHNAAAQASIARFAAAFPNVKDPKTQIYALVQGESSFGRDKFSGQYAGYFQLGSDETYGRMGLSESQFAALPFDEQMDAYTEHMKRVDPTGQKVTNLGLFNAAGSLSWQTKPLDTVVYHATGGTAFEAKAAYANRKTWGKYSPSGVGGDITIGGIEQYYARGNADVNRQIAAAGVAASPTAVAAMQAPQGPQVSETLPSGATVMRGAYSETPIIGVPSEAANVLTKSGTNRIDPQILVQAAQIAQLGNTNRRAAEAAVNKFLTDNKIETSPYECGEFVAAIVKGSGGKPASSYAAGAAWRYYANEIPHNQGQPGDVFSSKNYTYLSSGPLPPGAVRGGHAAMIGPGGYNPKTGEYDVIQADPPARHNSKMSTYVIRGFRDDPNSNPTASTDQTASDAAPPGGLLPWPKDAVTEDARQTIDRINKRADTGEPHIKINIRHRNAPPDVTAKADGPAFKGSTMDRSNAPPSPPPEALTKFKAGGLEFA